MGLWCKQSWKKEITTKGFNNKSKLQEVKMEIISMIVRLPIKMGIFAQQVHIQKSNRSN